MNGKTSSNTATTHAVIFREGENFGHGSKPWPVVSIGTEAELRAAMADLCEGLQARLAVVPILPEPLTEESLEAAVASLSRRIGVTISIWENEIRVNRQGAAGEECIPCRRASADWGQVPQEPDWYVQFWLNETRTDVDGLRVIDITAEQGLVELTLEPTGEQVPV